jgi:hypothetical protein
MLLYQLNYVPPLTNISVNADTLKVPPVLFAKLYVLVILFGVAPVRNISVNADTLNVPPVLFVKV